MPVPLSKPTPAPPSKTSQLRRMFLTGLLTLLPIWLTWVVVKFVFTLLSDMSKPWVGPIAQRIASSFPSALGWFNAAFVQATIALIATLALIVFVGWLARRVFGQRLLSWLELLVQRIPLANMIYNGSRKLLDILQTQPGSTQRVVMIEFPHQNMKAIGLVTRVIHEEGTGRELAAVYVPTTPNPTSGYLEIVPVERLTPTDWTVDQAMSFIISGGAVAPDTVPFTSAAQAAQGARASDGPSPSDQSPSRTTATGPTSPPPGTASGSTGGRPT